MPKEIKVFNWHGHSMKVTANSTETAPTIPAAMGMGGSNQTCPVLIVHTPEDIVVGLDTYNQQITGQVTKTLRSGNTNDDIPAVLRRKQWKAQKKK